MIFKNFNLLIFQFPFQTKLFTKYDKDIFANGTFYIAPKISYQVFISRTCVEELNSFFTIFFFLQKNKKQETNEVLFEEIKKHKYI